MKDFTHVSFRTPNKGKDVHYSDPVLHYVDGVIVAPERVGRGVDELRTLVTVRGFTPWDYLDRIKAGKTQVIEMNDGVKCLRIVLAGRADGAYMNVAAASYLMREHLKKPGALVLDPGLPKTESDYAMSTLAAPSVLAEFNEFLRHDKAEIAALKAKYRVGPATPPAKH